MSNMPENDEAWEEIVDAKSQIDNTSIANC